MSGLNLKRLTCFSGAVSEPPGWGLKLEIECQERRSGELEILLPDEFWGEIKDEEAEGKEVIKGRQLVEAIGWLVGEIITRRGAGCGKVWMLVRFLRLIW